MAIFNEILAGRFNRALQKIFAIKGSPPVRQLAGEIAPQIAIQSGDENRSLEGWHRFAQRITLGSVVGQIAATRFRNPTLNLIAVLEKLVIRDSVANTLIFSLGQTTVDLLSGTFTGVRMDARFKADATAFSSQMLFSTASNAPAIPTSLVDFSQIDLAAATNYEYIQYENQELTILPGDALNIREQSTPGAELITVNIIWRERLLEESERTA